MVGSDDPDDQCPEDPEKLSPGLCGCGLSDSYLDSDGDLTLDCVDACPNNSIKSEPGVCGCAASDSDANGNGQADCFDPSVADLVPGKPKVSVTKSKLVVKMEQRAGVEYLLEISVTKPRTGGRAARPRVKYYTSSSAEGAISKPSRGSSVRVRYAFKVIGSDTDFSQWSRSSRLTVTR
jgi:hypothetical protein